MNQTDQRSSLRACALTPVCRFLLLLLLSLSISGIQPLGAQDALKIDEKGNVGIGTDKPNSKLHIKTRSGEFAFPEWGPGNNRREILSSWRPPADSVDLGVMVRFWGNYNIGAVKKQLYSDIGQNKNGDFAINSNDVERLVIHNETGNVGIGIATPDANLHVNGTSKFSGNANFTGNVGIGANSPKGKLHVTGDIYAKGSMYLYSYDGDGKDGTAYIQARDDSGSSNIRLQVRTQKAGKYVDAMNVDSEGNIGIGTTTQKTKLDVNGTVEMKGLNINQNKPIVFRRFKNIANKTIKDTKNLNNYNPTLFRTEYSCEIYNAAIVGFYASGYDIEETHDRQWSMRMENIDNLWHIRLIMPSSGDKNKGNWEVDVLFIDKNMADIIGY